jgi:tRNA(adenine34) deaminase
MTIDERFIRHCITLARTSFEQGDLAFGCVITRHDEIIAESGNRRNLDHDVTSHAEIEAMKCVQQKYQVQDFSDCTIYSNCEPCAMCSFMIRELKFKRVVFGSYSPVMGGYSKWKILQDPELETLKPFYGPVPEIQVGILEKETGMLLEEQQKKFRT